MYKRLFMISQRAFILVTGMAATPLAMAHHPMDGAMPTTAWQGLLSGLGHPVIELDHFVFVMAVGILSAMLGPQRRWTVPAFVVATMAGTLMSVNALPLAQAGILVMMSIVMAGGMMVRNLRQTAVIACLVAIGGVAHGHAYGEAVIGAEPSPVVAYLAGIAIIQWGVAGVAAFFTEKMLARPQGLAIQRAGGCLIALTGIIMHASAFV